RQGSPLLRPGNAPADASHWRNGAAERTVAAEAARAPGASQLAAAGQGEGMHIFNARGRAEPHRYVGSEAGSTERNSGTVPPHFDGRSRNANQRTAAAVR